MITTSEQEAQLQKWARIVPTPEGWILNMYSVETGLIRLWSDTLFPGARLGVDIEIMLNHLPPRFEMHIRSVYADRKDGKRMYLMVMERHNSIYMGPTFTHLLDHIDLFIANITSWIEQSIVPRELVLYAL